MNAKHVALLALLGLGGSALVAQPPDAPPPDQYQAPDSYAAQPADSSAVQQAAYDPQPPDQYAPDQGGPVDETYFYDQLSPYGHWVESRDHGWVWLPYGIRAGWRPYALGHWVMSDYGWTWVSDEPFGWATYHYGRWAYDPDYGWEWIPGYEWGPAWVAWRTGGGYIGWAPLPPEVRFRAGIGLDFGGVDLNVVLGPTHFCFVEERAFLRPNVFTYVEPPARNVTIIHNTTNITKYTVVNNRVVNQGIAVQHVEQVTGQRVQRLQVTAVKSGSGRSAQVRGNQLTVFQPTIVRKSTSTPPPPPQQRVRASGADLQRQHQQETQALQAQQAQERARLQQIHQREVQSQGAAQGNQRQRSAQEQQQQQQQGGQRQATQERASSQDLAQKHQAEVQAQQQQHQREQQQLEARHRAEQQSAQRQPPPQQQQRKGEQPQKEKKPPEKSPPPPRR